MKFSIGLNFVSTAGFDIQTELLVSQKLMGSILVGLVIEYYFEHSFGCKQMLVNDLLELLLILFEYKAANMVEVDNDFNEKSVDFLDLKYNCS